MAQGKFCPCCGRLLRGRNRCESCPPDAKPLPKPEPIRITPPAGASYLIPATENWFLGFADDGSVRTVDEAPDYLNYGAEERLDTE